MVSSAAPPPATGTEPGSRPERVLAVEDVVLAVWLGVLEPLVRREIGDDLLTLIESLDLRLMEVTWDTGWAWLAQPGAVLSALLCFTLLPLAFALHNPIPRSLRRALALPAALVGTSLLRDVARAIGSDGLHEEATLIAVHVACSLLPFGLLVAAPRLIVGAPKRWGLWVGRFALFYAAWWVGAVVGR